MQVSEKSFQVGPQENTRCTQNSLRFPDEGSAFDYKVPFVLLWFGLNFFFLKLGTGSSQLARTKKRECGQSQGRAETRRSGSLTPRTSQLVGGGKGEEEGSHTEPGQVGGARPAWGETRRGHHAAAASLRAARTPARAPSARRRLPVPVPVRARGEEAPQGRGTHRVPRG